MSSDPPVEDGPRTGTDLHCLRRPSATGDGPTVVLLHGITDAAACWETVAAALDPRYDVVMPDARGHGTSPLPDEDAIVLSVLAADVARLLDPDEPAVVIGHSMGAATAAVLAAERPDLVHALVLEDPPWLDGPPADADRFDHAGWVRGLQELDHSGRVAAGRAAAPHWSEGELQRWAVSKDQVDLRFFERYDPAEMAAWRGWLTKIEAPTLLVTGDLEHGALVTPEVAATVAELMPNVRVEHLTGAGHSIHRDEPDAYLDAVHAFLREVLA